MNIEQMKLVIGEILRNTDLTPCVVGHRGVGKTAGIIQICRDAGFTYAPLRLGQMEVGDLVGIPYREGETMHWSRPGWWPTDDAPPTLIHCDELNRAQQEDTLQAIFQFVEPPLEGVRRALHSHKLHPKHRVVVTINPPDGTYQVAPLDRALLDRMVLIHVESDPSCWLDYAASRSLDTDVCSFITQNPRYLATGNQGEGIRMEPSERSWEMISILRRHCRFPRDLEMELYAGILGEETAVVFSRWLSDRDARFIDGGAILSRWPEVRAQVLAQRPDQMAATMHDLSGRLGRSGEIGEEELENLIDYLFDLSAELQFAQTKELARIPQVAARLCESSRSDAIIELIRKITHAAGA